MPQESFELQWREDLIATGKVMEEDPEAWKNPKRESDGVSLRSLYAVQTVVVAAYYLIAAKHDAVEDTEDVDNKYVRDALRSLKLPLGLAANHLHSEIATVMEAASQLEHKFTVEQLEGIIKNAETANASYMESLHSCLAEAKAEQSKEASK